MCVCVWFFFFWWVFLCFGGSFLHDGGELKTVEENFSKTLNCGSYLLWLIVVSPGSIIHGF